MNSHEEILKRLKGKFKRTARGCLEWTGTVNHYGYGVIRIDKRLFVVSRITFVLANGPIAKGALVCHHCDNKLCAEPTHLYEGNAKLNARDRELRAPYIHKGGRRVLPLELLRRILKDS